MLAVADTAVLADFAGGACTTPLILLDGLLAFHGMLHSYWLKIKYTVTGIKHADRADSNLESTADANREVASGSVIRWALLVAA